MFQQRFFGFALSKALRFAKQLRGRWRQSPQSRSVVILVLPVQELATNASLPTVQAPFRGCHFQYRRLGNEEAKIAIIAKALPIAR